MKRLSASTSFPQNVMTPNFDRALLKPGIVHLGFGAFHRAHQAVCTDAALEADFGDWGIVGVSLRSSDIIRDLMVQDHLFSVTSRSADAVETKLVGSVVGGVSAKENREDLLALLANPAIRIVSMTVTEKAYGIDPVTRGLDRGHPIVSEDLANPETPAGVIGVLVEGLARRHAAGILPFTVLCCDNLPTNGRVVKRLVVEMAAARNTTLAGWINQHGAFPCSMVDRIVPAATTETRRRAAELLSAEDALALDTEPFMQWVIEDHFANGRPAWEAGGALFVDDVEPYEKMKLRMLNGAHSMIAYIGQIRGLEYVRDVMAVPELGDLVERYIRAAGRTLQPVPGIDLDSYRAQLLSRFANPTIAHSTRQIAMDGSQKLPQRTFLAAIDDLAAGGDGEIFAYATAAWIAYLLREADLEDPRREELKAAASKVAERGDPRFIFDIPGLFPLPLLGQKIWLDRVGKALAELRANDRGTL